MYKIFITYFKIILSSIILSIYIFQLYLTIKYSGTSGEISKKISIYENTTGLKFDTRTKFEFYNDLKKNNENVVVTVTPSFNLEYFGKQYLIDNLFPLAGISKKQTINCNENGYFSIYESDRYGFNNPDYEWNENKIEYMLVGDSSTHGNCVNRPHDIGSRLRNISKKNVLNLGYAANGPLFQFATLREYLDKNVKNVLWLYNENDLYDLNRDLRSEVLLRYLNDKNFYQNLKSKQKKIDKHLNYLIKEMEPLESQKQLNEKKEKSSLLYKIEKFITLKNIRELFLQKYITTHKVNEEINPKFTEILLKSKKLSLENGSNFYFIFLPSFSRYGAGYDKNEIEYNQIKKIVTELNIPFIDLHHNLFLKHDDKFKFFALEINAHYSPLGYKEISQTIYNKISKF